MTLKRLVPFVLIGLVTVAVGEWQFSVFIRGDLANFWGSVFFNTVYLLFAAVIAGWIARRMGSGTRTLLVLAGLAGLAGLGVEWFLIGNSPWGNPAANQPGMFAYWACMVVVPWILTTSDPRLGKLKRTMLAYGIVCTAIACLVQLLPNADVRFVLHIWLVILGYLGLLVLSLGGYAATVKSKI